jgi:four helix bundle protein
MDEQRPVKSFKDLLVWQKALDFSVDIYRMTKEFPPDERFGLTAELRTTSRSIVYNIAEGHQRRTTAEYVHFLGIARGSAGELETQVILATRLGYVTPGKSEEMLGRHAEVVKMLNGLMRSLERMGGPES